MKGEEIDLKENILKYENVGTELTDITQYIIELTRNAKKIFRNSTL